VEGERVLDCGVQYRDVQTTTSESYSAPDSFFAGRQRCLLTSGCNTNTDLF
jgi:hypothetical protein